MTLISFPVKPEPTKRLDEMDWDKSQEWDMALGKPHGVVGDNGYRDINGACTPENPPRFIKFANPPEDETNDLAAYVDKISPDHYKLGDIEVIQLTEKLGFCEGNVVKYVCRHKAKNGKEDLLKARWYLDRLIAQS
jgi:hypothetical protein